MRKYDHYIEKHFYVVKATYSLCWRVPATRLRGIRGEHTWDYIGGPTN